MKNNLGNKFIKMKITNHVINQPSSTADGNGAHWTAVKVGNKRIVCFDIFRMFPLDLEAVKTLVKQEKVQNQDFFQRKHKIRKVKILVLCYYYKP